MSQSLFFFQFYPHLPPLSRILALLALLFPFPMAFFWPENNNNKNRNYITVFLAFRTEFLVPLINGILLGVCWFYCSPGLLASRMSALLSARAFSRLSFRIRIRRRRNFCLFPLALRRLSPRVPFTVFFFLLAQRNLGYLFTQFLFFLCLSLAHLSLCLRLQKHTHRNRAPPTNTVHLQKSATSFRGSWHFPKNLDSIISHILLIIIGFIVSCVLGCRRIKAK